ncbi:MAG: DUF882 domain-containing protein [Azospirillaceae bacterium]
MQKTRDDIIDPRSDAAAGPASGIGRRRLLAAGAAIGLGALAPTGARAGGDFGEALADSGVSLEPGAQRQLVPSGLAPERTGLDPTPKLAPERTIRDLRQMLAERSGRRTVKVFNAHTNESLRATYFADGTYREDELARLDHFFRDWRAQAMVRMDPDAIDIIASLQALAETETPLVILSGYRTRRTNQMLANRYDGVAANSFHMRGMAIDLTLPGYSVEGLWRNALALGRGGVGYYPENGFIHVDSGPVRRWS